VSGVQRRISARALVCLLAASAPLLASCGTHERRDRYEQTAPAGRPAPSGSDTTNAPPPPSQAAASPESLQSEPAVMDVLRTANTIAIRSARLARTRSTNDAVRAYAVQVLEDQMAASAKLSQLARRMDVRPRSDPASRELTSQADQARATFETKRGDSFDRAYIDNEIQFHQKLLDLLDRTLAPAAADSEMKAYLAAERSRLAAQLNHAQHVQSALSP
jgi:putative membrane protein